MTSFNGEGFQIKAQDLAAISPGENDHHRVYNHDGSSSLTLTDGSTTSKRGWYMWDNSSGSWFPMGQHADLVDGYHGQDLAAVAESRTITGSWDFSTDPTINGEDVITQPELSNQLDFTNLSGALAQSQKPFDELPLSIPVTKWSDGLSNEEVWRMELSAGQQLEVHRLEIQPKGGGDVTGLSVDLYDATNATQLASTTDVTEGSPIATSGDGANVLLRVSNSSGNYQNAGIGGQLFLV